MGINEHFEGIKTIDQAKNNDIILQDLSIKNVIETLAKTKTIIYNLLQ